MIQTRNGGSGRGLVASSLVAWLILISVPTVAFALSYAELLLWWFGLDKPHLSNEMTRVVKSNHDAANLIVTENWDIWKDDLTFQMQLPAEICDISDIMQQSLETEDGARAIAEEAGERLLEDVLMHENPVQKAVNRIRLHWSQYCSLAEEKLGLCEAAEEGMRNADLSAETLFSQRGLDKDKANAAWALAENLIVPDVETMIDPELAETDQGDTYYAALNSLKAMKSLAYRGIARRIALVERQGEKPSELEMLAVEVERRYGNPAWAEEIVNNTPGANDRVRLLMDAYDMRLRVKEYEQRSYEMALMAMMASNQAFLATDAKMRRLREITQRSAAKKGQ